MKLVYDIGLWIRKYLLLSRAIFNRQALITLSTFHCMIKNKRPSLQNVADLVGVTKMTVSRYLKNPELVSVKMRTKICAAVEALGYIPNKAPNILSNAKSNAIGVLVPSMSNHVFDEVIRGIESVMKPAGYQTMLAHYGYSAAQEEKHIASMLSYNVDGLLLSESCHSKKTLSMIKTAGVPIIEMMDTTQAPIMQCVGFDNINASRDMVLTLLAKGYRNIIYLGALVDVRDKLKHQGYQVAMTEYGLTPRQIMAEKPSSVTLGVELLAKTLTQFPETDAVFCTNDDIAIGVMLACQKQQINVPSTLAIAGVHGNEIGTFMSPQLATIITPREEIGKTSATQLLQRLNGQPIEQAVIDLGYQIHLGGSI